MKQRLWGWWFPLAVDRDEGKQRRVERSGVGEQVRGREGFFIGGGGEETLEP